MSDLKDNQSLTESEKLLFDLEVESKKVSKKKVIFSWLAGCLGLYGVHSIVLSDKRSITKYAVGWAVLLLTYISIVSYLCFSITSSNIITPVLVGILGLYTLSNLYLFIIWVKDGFNLSKMTEKYNNDLEVKILNKIKEI